MVFDSYMIMKECYVGSMSKGEVSANGTTYNESTVTANEDLSFTSGKDTNIKGGMLSGEKVTGNVGNNLNIESKQASNSYKENNKSVGASVGLGSNKAVSGSASVGKIDSKYESVTDQSGIYAGKEGKQYNPLKNILGEEFYNNFDSTAKVISLTGDAKKLYEIVKNKNFSNIDWDSIVTDELEQNKLIETLDNLGLMLDIKTINELRGSGNENKQNN